MRVCVVRQLDAVDLAPEGRIPQHERTRDRAIGKDLGLVVDVSQEEVKGADPLDQPRFDQRPLHRRDHAREEIEGKGALGARFVAVDGERDALVAEREVGERAAAAELDRGQRLDAVDDVGVVRARRAVRLEHLVEEAHRVVVAEHGPSSAAVLARPRRHRTQRDRASRVSGAPLSRMMIHPVRLFSPRVFSIDAITTERTGQVNSPRWQEGML